MSNTAQAAENKQSENDRIARENEANEKERKRKAEEAKKQAERERKQISDQTADRNKAIQKYTDDVAEAVRQSELDIQQQRIDMPQNFRRPVKSFEQEQLFNEQDREVV